MATRAAGHIQGESEAGWGKVVDAFRRNFEEHNELGASCCVYVDGHPVVDVWAGIADASTGRPWARDTVAITRSTTKGATAICAHMLVERGELDLDAPVARYWPEFATAGKHDLRVRWLLSHQAGLPTVDAALTLQDLCAWTPVIDALAAQKPLWEPGKQHTYHGWTFGFLVGEVVRRVTGKSLGTFFAEEVAQPLALGAWIGLPEEIEPDLAPRDEQQLPDESNPDFDAVEPASIEPDTARAAAQKFIETITDPSSVFARAGTLNGAAPDPLRVFDLRSMRAAEFPSSNLATNGRSLARMYAATVSDVDRIRLLKPETVAAMIVPQTTDSTPFGIPPEIAPSTTQEFSLGFIVPSLLGPHSFGHGGTGGSIGFADPDSHIGFGYVMNRFSLSPADPRAANLASAVRDSL